MKRGRLEAFSDGVLAIIITIMVLEIKPPAAPTLAALEDMCPELLGYAVSFLYVGIYWINHHHLMHTVKFVSAGILWANLHLLFWLSLIPVVTAWVGAAPTAQLPAAAYGATLLMAGVAWLLLQRAIIARHGDESALAKAIGSDRKGSASALLYLLAIGFSFVHAYISEGIYAFIALIWLVPDRRIEAALASNQEEEHAA